MMYDAHGQLMCLYLKLGSGRLAAFDLIITSPVMNHKVGSMQVMTQGAHSLGGVPLEVESYTAGTGNTV